MKDLKKRDVVWTIFFLAALLLSLAAVASAQDDAICSNVRVAGEWGHSFTGTLFLPTPSGPVPVLFAGVGRATFDADGNVSGRQHSSRGGSVSEDTIKGTLQVNSDCTGTLTVGLY